MPLVDVPTKGIVEFPDSMDTEAIEAAIHKNYPELAPKESPAPTTETGTTGLHGPAAAVHAAMKWATSEIPFLKTDPNKRMAANLRQMAIAEQVTPTQAQEESLVDMRPIAESTAGQVVTGVEQGVADFAAFFKTPLGIATLGIGSMPAGIQRIVAGAFATHMASQTPEIARELGAEIGKPEDERDPQKIARLVTGATANTAFAALAGAHATAPRPKTPIEIESDRIKPVAPMTAEALKESVPVELMKPEAPAAGVFIPETRTVEAPTKPTVSEVVEDVMKTPEAETLPVKTEESVATAEVEPPTEKPSGWTDERWEIFKKQRTRAEAMQEQRNEEFKAAPAAPTAEVAAAKVTEHIQAVKRDEGMRPAKEVKSELVQRLEDQIANAKSETYLLKDETVKGKIGQTVRGSQIEGDKPLLEEVYRLRKEDKRSKTIDDAYIAALEKHAPKVTIEIPGDGTFTIWNTKEALQQVLDRAKKLNTSPGAPVAVKRSGTSKADQEWIDKTLSEPGLLDKAEAKITELQKDLRSGKKQFTGATGLEPVVLDAALTAARLAIKATKSVDAGVRAATDYIRKNHPEAKFNEKELDSLLRGMYAAPGAPQAQEPTSKAQIAKLSEKIKDMAIEAPKETKMSEVFDVGKTSAGIKESVKGVTEGLKAAGSYLKTKLENKPVWTEYKDALGQRHLELSESAHNAKKFSKISEKAVPSKLNQEAISDYIDTGGDPAVLDRAAAETKGQYKAGYEAAKSLSPEHKAIADEIKGYFESRLEEAREAGILEDGIEDYIHRTYEAESPWKQGILAELRSGVNTSTPALAKKRVFEYDFEAEQAGLKPIKSFIKRVAAYDLSLNKAMADRKLVKSMMEIKMPDGRPMIDVGGIGIPIEGKAGTTDATLIKPHFRPEDTQNPKNNRGDYKPYDYPALRKWKWVAKDSEGKPIFVQGDVLIHPEAMKQVRTLFERSAIRQNPIGRGALALSSTVKQTMLDLSGFHLAQITVHGWEHRSFKPVKEIDFTDPNTRGLIKGGLVVGDTRGYEMFSEGLAGSSLTKHIPGIGPKLQAWNEWLFNSYIPRLKVSTGLHALERNKQRFPNLTPEEVNHLTANQMNAAFGELNYEMLGRSKTMQDALRLSLLAPDFLEARGRFASQAGTKYGREQLTALMLGAATMYVTARIVNKLLTGQYHWEPKNAFSVVYDGKAYSLRTVQGDILHLASEPGRFFYNRLNPVYGRTGFEFLTGRDAFGRKRGFGEQVQDFATTAVPISLRGLLNPTEQTLMESMLNAFGITERRSSAISTIAELAREFKEKNKIGSQPGEFIYDPDKDPYRPIRQSAIFLEPEDVAKQIDKVVSEGTLTRNQIREHFMRYAQSPFTGTRKNDSAFVKSLTDDQKRLYQDALKEKRELLKKFNAGYQIYIRDNPTRKPKEQP